MKKFDCILFSTTILNEETKQDLVRLTDSAKEQGLRILHIILVQNPNQMDLPVIDGSDKYRIEFLHSEKVLSLSRARNEMINSLSKFVDIEENLCHFVAFPDDDCWYPYKNLFSINQKFIEYRELDLFFCNYGSEDHWDAATGLTVKNATIKDLVRNASSNTVFVSIKLFRLIGGFSEELGVGSPNNGGEDLDYAIKANLHTQTAFYTAHKLIGHRDKDLSLRGKYYRGSMMVLNRYKMKKIGITKEAFRKVLVGIVLILTKEISVSEFKRSFKPYKG